MNKEIKAYSKEELSSLVKELGEPAFRTQQLINWLYVQGCQSYDDMTNLPASLRDKLSKQHPLHLTRLVQKKDASDGVSKYVVEFFDGSQVETVAIPSLKDTDKDRTNRLTVCLSTQIGCGMGCLFCATGKEGFKRNLLPGEIVDQVVIAQSDMQKRVSNLVLMGQGEPFLNYDSVLAALRFVNDTKGLAIGARRITVSTCGIIQGIKMFSQEPEQFNLAVSLHSARQATRDMLMPSLSNMPLYQLKESLASYVNTTNRRVTLEYCMIKDINDGEKELTALIKFCKDLLCHVNLLPVNSIENSSYEMSPTTTLVAWKKTLTAAGIPTTVRNSRGADIAGACGQLKNAH